MTASLSAEGAAAAAGRIAATVSEITVGLLEASLTVEGVGVDEVR